MAGQATVGGLYIRLNDAMAYLPGYISTTLIRCEIHLNHLFFHKKVLCFTKHV
jgi:hypothetical protein